MLNGETERIVENDSEDHMDKRSARLSPFEAILDSICRPRAIHDARQNSAPAPRANVERMGSDG